MGEKKVRLHCGGICTNLLLVVVRLDLHFARGCGMRHFSGELDGLRLLMADELDLIAGGDGEDTDENPQPPPTDLGTITVTAN